MKDLDRSMVIEAEKGDLRYVDERGSEPIGSMPAKARSSIIVGSV